jgi:predicted permease
MMEWLNTLKLKLRAIFYRRQLDRDLRDEIAFHKEMRAADLRRRGHAEAAPAAARRFGNETLIRENCREAWTFVAIERFVSDLRYAARSLRKRPSFTIVAVLTLTLGIGANSAVFSAIDAILLRPLPFPNGDQLMALEQYRPKSGPIPMAQNSGLFVAPLRLTDWNQMNSTFQAISGYYTEDVAETSSALPEKFTRAWVAPRFFQVWGVPPAFGRQFSPEEERFRGPAAVIISDRFWRRRFAADPNAIGKQLRIERAAFTIVGIMPASFLFPNRSVDFWSPSPTDAPFAQNREATWFVTTGRLKSDVTPDQAQADLSMVQSRLAQQYPKTDGELAVRVRPFKQAVVNNAGESLWILFAAVTVLMLIACTNIAALLLARSADREQEIVIRLSLGASRASVMRRLLAEVFLVASAGSALGLIVAAAASTAFRTLAANLPRVEEIQLNWTLVAYSLVCAIGATLICGLVPAIRSIRRSVAGSIARTGRTVAPARNSLQWLLVGLQVTFSVALLVSAGLLLRSFQELGKVRPGFEIDHILTFRVSANWAETTDFKALWRRIDVALNTLRAIPGIEDAATSLVVPGVAFQQPNEVTVVEGAVDPSRKILANSRIVSNGYFSTMRIPLLAGEGCPEGDAALKAVLVNRSFVDTFLPGREALGYHIDYVPSRPFTGAGEIRGIVGDAREEGLNQEPAPSVYWCNSAGNPTPVFLVRTTGDPRSVAELVRTKIHEIEPNRSVFDVIPLQERLAETFAEGRLRTTLLTFFAATAISLACVGIYGTLSYFVNMRRREVGVRIALGAARSRITSQFLWLGVRVCVLGSIAGLCLAAVFTRMLSGLLYGVTASDPVTFGAVLLLMLATGALASLIPAIRAARLEPTVVLRDE